MTDRTVPKTFFFRPVSVEAVWVTGRMAQAHMLARWCGGTVLSPDAWDATEQAWIVGNRKVPMPPGFRFKERGKRPHAILFPLSGRPKSTDTQVAYPGCWLVKDEYGRMSRFTHDEFEKNFASAERLGLHRR